MGMDGVGQGREVWAVGVEEVQVLVRRKPVATGETIDLSAVL